MEYIQWREFIKYRILKKDFLPVICRLNSSIWLYTKEMAVRLG